MTHDTGTEADAVERVAAAIWEAEYREMVGEPPYPWDSSEWDEPGHEGQMEIDRAKARAAIAAMQPAPVAVSEAMVEAGEISRVEAWDGGGFWNVLVTANGQEMAGSDGDLITAIREAVRNAPEAHHD